MFIGLDLGTSSLKAILMDEEQQILAEDTFPLTVGRPHDGWSEQDPNTWFSAAEAALKSLAAKADCSQVTGIGLSGHMHGATLFDRSDKPLRPCMLWNDTRSHAEAAEMDADPQFRKITGNIVFPGFTAPKTEWVRRNEPAIFDQIAKVLLPKDALRLFLTGEHVSEMSDAAGTAWLDTGKRDWSPDLLAACHLSVEQMPRLVEGSAASPQCWGQLTAQSQGVPVITPRPRLGPALCGTEPRSSRLVPLACFLPPMMPTARIPLQRSIVSATQFQRPGIRWA